MRSSRRLLGCAAAALLLSACAASGPPPEAPIHDIDALEGVLGSESRPFVIRIPEGTRLPVMVDVSTPFMHAEGGAPAFHAVFDRTVFWYPRTPDRISFDGKTWQPLNAGHDGQLSFGMGKSDAEGIHANVRIALTPHPR